MQDPRILEDALVVSAVDEFHISAGDQQKIVELTTCKVDELVDTYHNFFMQFTDPEATDRAVEAIEVIRGTHATELAEAQAKPHELQQSDTERSEARLFIDDAMLHFTRQYGPSAAFRIARAVKNLDNR
jgi:hypothetical protein